MLAVALTAYNNAKQNPNLTPTLSRIKNPAKTTGVIKLEQMLEYQLLPFK